MRAATANLGMGGAWLAAVLACGGSSPEPKAPDASPPPAEAAPAPSEPEPEARSRPDVPPPGSTLDRVMQAHFRDALLIRQAVIAGRPEDAVDPAHVLMQMDDLETLPLSWRGFAARMQRDAARIENSTVAAQAAAATADLGVSCGDCHQQNGGPKPSDEPPPPPSTTVEGRMQRHVWATERLWEGLFIPSNESWLVGAQALSAEPFPDEVLQAGGVQARSAADDFAKLVARGPQKKTTSDRAALYAELLLTCGSCHRALGK